MRWSTPRQGFQGLRRVQVLIMVRDLYHDLSQATLKEFPYAYCYGSLLFWTNRAVLGQFSLAEIRPYVRQHQLLHNAYVESMGALPDPAAAFAAALDRCMKTSVGAPSFPAEHEAELHT